MSYKVAGDEPFCDASGKVLDAECINDLIVGHEAFDREDWHAIAKFLGCEVQQGDLRHPFTWMQIAQALEWHSGDKVVAALAVYHATSEKQECEALKYLVEAGPSSEELELYLLSGVRFCVADLANVGISSITIEILQTKLNERCPHFGHRYGHRIRQQSRCGRD